MNYDSTYSDDDSAYIAGASTWIGLTSEQPEPDLQDGGGTANRTVATPPMALPLRRATTPSGFAAAGNVLDARVPLGLSFLAGTSI